MRHDSLRNAALVATLAAFLTDCSRSPVAPVTGAQVAPGTGSSATAVLPDDPPPVTNGGTPISRVVSLSAQDEGVIVVGRWTLWLRKNTLRMPGTVTMTVADPEAMECQIAISPPEANNFRSPAILTANLSDVPGVDYNSTTMLVWNDTWVKAINSATHAKQQNVVAFFSALNNCKLVLGTKN